MRALDIRPVVRNIIFGARNAVERVPIRAEVTVDVEIKAGTSGGIGTAHFVCDIYSQVDPTRNLFRPQLNVDYAIVSQSQVSD